MTNEPGPAGVPGYAGQPSPAPWVPVPDPTALTTAAVDRGVAALRELLEARLDGMDKANRVLAANVEAQAKLAEQAVGHLKALHDERFISVAQQFQERDIRDSMASQDAKDAIAAALMSARERAQITSDAAAATAARVEASLSTQLTQIGELAAANRDQLADQIASLKERLDRGEGSTSGHTEQRTEASAAFSQRLVLLGVIISIVVIIVNVAITLIVHK